MHARWTWLAGSVRERETHARSDNSFFENDTSITRRGAAITISPSANPPEGDMDIVDPKGIPPMRADSWKRYTSETCRSSVCRAIPSSSQRADARVALAHARHNEPRLRGRHLRLA